jgi:hypothetical protein
MPVYTASQLSMGPLVVAMPRTNYRGAFSSPTDVPSSKLIGDEAEDVEMIARQMASRLSQRLGVPIFVCCSFADTPSILDGIDLGMVQQRAAALAERQIWRILEKKLAQSTDS